jgi:hypothetical protein
LLPYWLLFGYFGLGALFGRARDDPAERFARPPLMLAALFVAVMIGLRYKVGTDWPTYVAMFRRAGALPLTQNLQNGDPGYMLVNWLVQQGSGPFWVVNLVCGVVFAWGYYRFVSVQADPWLAALIGVPYLVIVVAMGYSRQAVAIGILMAGLADLIQNRGFWRFFIYVAIATLFHSSAIVMLPLAIIGLNRQRLAQFTIVPALGYLVYTLIFSTKLDQFVESYIHRRWNSQGALIRVLLCALPAVVYFVYRRRLRFTEDEFVLWRNFSVAALACLALLFVLPSSTAVDRVALYILPLEIAVLSRLTFLIKNRTQARILVTLFSFSVLYVWLNFAANAGDWLPYRHY